MTILCTFHLPESLDCAALVQQLYCMWRTKAEISPAIHITASEHWVCLIFKSIVWRFTVFAHYGPFNRKITHNSTAEINWSLSTLPNNWHTVYLISVCAFFDFFFRNREKRVWWIRYIWCRKLYWLSRMFWRKSRWLESDSRSNLTFLCLSYKVSLFETNF